MYTDNDNASLVFHYFRMRCQRWTQKNLKMIMAFGGIIHSLGSSADYDIYRYYCPQVVKDS